MQSMSRQNRGTIWALIGLILGAGWVAYGLLGSGNQVFLTVMILATMLLAGGAAILLRGSSNS
jgi:hypothetical protein